MSVNVAGEGALKIPPFTRVAAATGKLPEVNVGPVACPLIVKVPSVLTAEVSVTTVAELVLTVMLCRFNTGISSPVFIDEPVYTR